MDDTATPEMGTEHVAGTELSTEDAANLIEERMEDSLETETPTEESIEEPKEEPVEQSTEEESEEAEAETEEVTEDQEPETEELELSTLSELAEHFELDPDSMSQLKVKVKVNGEENEVTLSEAVNGYQREADYSRKTAEVAEQRDEVLAERQAIQAVREQHIQAIDQLGHVLRQSIEGESIEHLRESDPAEYAAAMEDRRQKIEIFNQMKAEREVLSQQSTYEQQQRFEAVKAQEYQSLIRDFPEWSDPEKMQEGNRAISQYLINEGYSQQEIGNVIDHRTIRLADKARLYDEMQKQAPVVKKKVIKTPKYQKAGRATPKGDTSKDDALRNRLRSSGKANDAAALLMERWSN